MKAMSISVLPWIWCVIVVGMLAGCETYPLHEAAQSGQTQTARVLLAQGESPERLDELGRTPLMWAAATGHPETVKLLLEKGAKVNAANGSLQTALMMAVDTETVKLLLQKDADVDAKDYSNNTALRFYVFGDRVELVKLLLTKCPDSDVLGGDDFFGKSTAPQWAKRKKRKAIIPVLEGYPGQVKCKEQEIAGKKAEKAAEEDRRVATVEKAAELEKAGISAEERGNAYEALGRYRSALEILGEAAAPEIDSRIRRRGFKLAAKLGPEEIAGKDAQRFAIRASVILQEAKTPADFSRVISEYRKAITAAPWWSDAYYNLALVLEKAGDPAAAKRNLEYYRLANPDGKDAAAVERKIVELEVHSEILKEKAAANNLDKGGLPETIADQLLKSMKQE